MLHPLSQRHPLLLLPVLRSGFAMRALPELIYYVVNTDFWCPFFCFASSFPDRPPKWPTAHLESASSATIPMCAPPTIAGVTNGHTCCAKRVTTAITAASTLTAASNTVRLCVVSATRIDLLCGKCCFPLRNDTWQNKMANHKVYQHHVTPPSSAWRGGAGGGRAARARRAAPRAQCRAARPAARGCRRRPSRPCRRAQRASSRRAAS